MNIFYKHLKNNISIIIPTAIFIIGMWLSTGNLSPYANTLPENGPEAFMLDTTNMQIYNCDHPHHIAVFNMLDGKPKTEWDFSVVMRRILFPLLAFPLMKLLGYETGGVLFGILLNLLAYFIFIRFIKNKYGYKSSLISAWLLSLYPGIMYWVGTPYAYSCIVSFTIFSTILLFKIQDTVKIKWVLLYFSLLGVLFTGYDLISFFLPAALIILFIKRKYIIIPLAILLMVLPSVISNLILSYFFEIGFKNPNSNIYSVIINSYMQIFDNISNWNWLYEKWLRYVLYQNNFILILIKIFFKSNFYVLPFMFLLFYIIGRFRYYIKLNLTEGSLVLITLLIFLFNHLAPKYGGYQMRDDWIARIYQPVFIVYILYISRVFNTIITDLKLKKFIVVSFILGMLFNALIIFSPVTKNPIGEKVYLDFYKHTSRKEMIKNLDKYGRKPLFINRQ